MDVDQDESFRIPKEIVEKIATSYTSPDEDLGVGAPSVTDPEGEGRVKMTEEEMANHTKTPWGEDMAHQNLAGGQSLLLNGNRLAHTARILSEANYQYARHCVNSHDELIAACKDARENINNEKGCCNDRFAVLVLRTAITNAEGIAGTYTPPDEDLGDIAAAELAMEQPLSTTPIPRRQAMQSRALTYSEALKLAAEYATQLDERDACAHDPARRSQLEVLRDAFDQTFGTPPGSTHRDWWPGSMTADMISKAAAEVADVTLKEKQTVIDSLTGQLRDKDVEISDLHRGLSIANTANTRRLNENTALRAENTAQDVILQSYREDKAVADSSMRCAAMAALDSASAWQLLYELAREKIQVEP